MQRSSSKLSYPVLLALGSNLGDRFGFIESAVNTIIMRQYLIDAVCSPVYESPPFGYTNQPHYLNCCIAGRTNLQLPILHQQLEALEKELGRLPRPKWHEREIDIDILLANSYILRMPKLTIPHSQMCKRAFVLIPAADIVGNWLHPIAKRTIQELAISLPDDDIRSLRRTDFCITITR